MCARTWDYFVVVKVLPIVISAGSLVVAVTALVLTYRRSGQALDQARRTAASALWGAVQEAVQLLTGVDPTREPLGDRLTKFRVATIALVDEFDEWNGLDRWLESERQLGAALGRQVMESADERDSVDDRVVKLQPYHQWAYVLSQNLRRFRSAGYDESAAAKLTAAAQANADSLYARHGWERPPSAPAGVRPLE